MVEKRNSHLERVGHRRSIEVVEQLVDKRQLPVEVERDRQGVVSESVETRAHGATSRLPVERRKVPAVQPPTETVIDATTHRQEALDRIACGERVCRTPDTPRRMWGEELACPLD